MQPNARRQSPHDHAFRTHGEQAIERARELRKNSTDAEQKLWQRLATSRSGHRFRRQHPIAAYIVDFVCIKCKLIIELDGATHADNAAIAYDAARTATLEKLGYRVLRFWNNEVMENLDGVYQVVLKALQDYPSTPK